jgi:hypothetical protein
VEEQLAGWETMTLDQKKDFFDNYGNICIKVKTKGCDKEKEGCHKEKEGCPKAKEGCPKAKEGCGHKEAE